MCLAAAAGCGDKGSDPGQGSQQDWIALLASVVPSEFVLPSNADANAGLVASMDVEGKVHSIGVLRNGINFVNAGDVWSSGRGASDPPETTEVRLDVRSTPVNGVAQFVYSTMPSHPSGIVLAFDGTTDHRFRVTGSHQYPALIDSVQSVTAVNPTAPSSGATVVRSGGLAVTWVGGADTTVYVGAMVYRTSVPTQRQLAGVVRDADGALDIPSATLLAMPPGNTTLVVVRFRLRYVGSGSFRTGLLVEAGDARPIVLQ
jgi:hypothetical protein